MQRAARWARRLDRPLLVLEALRVDYPWASARLHAFILQGMRANRDALVHSPASYYPYVETAPGQGKGLLAALAEQACVVVCDQFPCFFIPRMLEAAARQVRVKMEAVDSCGLLPLAKPGREFSRAYDFRRFVQHNLAAAELSGLARENPLEGPALQHLGRDPGTGIEAMALGPGSGPGRWPRVSVNPAPGPGSGPGEKVRAVPLRPDRF